MGREDILAQVEALFAEKGYAGTSMADIAAAVGLKKASLYSHFTAKSDVYLGVIGRVHRRLLDEVESLAAQNFDPEDHLRTQMRQLSASGPVSLFRFTLFPPQDLLADVMPIFADFDRRFRNAISGALRNHLSSEADEQRVKSLTDIYIDLMNGLLSVQKFVPEEVFSDRLNANFDLFWELVEAS